MNVSKNIAVIGGGASGFMAAITAKETNKFSNVTIFEKTNKILTKVKISGGGRCNVTNATYSISKLIKSYPRGGNQLKKSFKIFNTKHTINWFNSRGVELKTEDDNRIFPASNNSNTIVNFLTNLAEKLGVRVEIKSMVKKVQITKDGFILSINNEKLKFEKIIIASGGSQKSTALQWISTHGYKIINPVPSLFTFNMPKNQITKLMGLSLDNVTTSIKGTSLKQTGGLLITHWGMSGPAILKLSSWGAKYLADLNYDFTVQVNWLSLNEEIVRKNIFNISSKKKIYNENPFSIPKRLWFFLLNKLEINEDKFWKELSKKNKNRLINILINDEYKIKGKTTFKEEFVSCGGVCLSEVNMLTMESKRHNGLYFAGELLNIDGITGGFNFQVAWTTGYLAGKNSVL